MERTNEVIAHLRTAKHDINASIDYSNKVFEREYPEGKPAYAKIAGKKWTYYVESLEVNIGRPADERGRNGHLPEHEDGSKSLETGLTVPDGQQIDVNQIPTGPKSAGWFVHIDLGPHKVVSRLHASIIYDAHSTAWYIQVNGRNGVKVDGHHVPAGQRQILQSGMVIEIAETQMMFLLPNTVPDIHPSILRQVDHDQEQEEDEEDGGGSNGVPGPRSKAQDGGHENSHAFQDQQRSLTSRNRQAEPGDAPAGQLRMGVSANELTAPGTPLRRINQAYARGLLLETTEEIDYASDAAKDLKPPHSYAQLIGMAILAAPEEKLTLANIYEWIKDKYAFYRFCGIGWQVSAKLNVH